MSDEKEIQVWGPFGEVPKEASVRLPVIKAEKPMPKMLTVPETITVKRKFNFSFDRETYDEVAEAINEYHTGKKNVSVKVKKTKEHQEALDNAFKSMLQTFVVEVDCKTGKRMVYKEKKRPNIFEIQISDGLIDDK